MLTRTSFLHLFLPTQHMRTRQEDCPIELTIFVLTQSYWPAFPNVTINMPAEMALVQEQFKAFYMNKHKNRRLMWQSSQGHCAITARFPLGTKELQLSIYQAVLILLFNAHKVLSFTQILQLTGIRMYL